MGTETMSNKIQMDDITDYDVFLSYPHTDHTEVMQICEALQARELTVWTDENDITDYASITRFIVEGLARSRVLLAYYSRNYSRSRACLNRFGFPELRSRCIRHGIEFVGVDLRLGGHGEGDRTAWGSFGLSG